MEENQSLFSLSIDPVTKSNLNSVANWAKFLAIVGFLVLLVALVGSILTLTIYSDYIIGSSSEDAYGQQIARNLRWATATVAFITIVIGYFPCLFLFKFANSMKKALHANSQTDLNRAFTLMKVYFRYLGLVILILIIIYSLTFFLPGNVKIRSVGREIIVIFQQHFKKVKSGKGSLNFQMIFYFFTGHFSKIIISASPGRIQYAFQ